MKKIAVVFAFMSLTVLAACNNPVVIPADLAITLPPNQEFVLRATLTSVPAMAAPEITQEAPTPTSTPNPTETPTQTPTRTPVPTRKSPYPISQGEPLIDMGFQSINLDNVKHIAKTGVDRISIGKLTHSAPSTDFSLEIAQ